LIGQLARLLQALQLLDAETDAILRLSAQANV